MVQSLSYLILVFSALARAFALAWPFQGGAFLGLEYGQPVAWLSAVSFLGVWAAFGFNQRWGILPLWGRFTLYMAVALLATWHWMSYALFTFAGLPWVLSWLAIALLAVFLACQAGLFLAFGLYIAKKTKSLEAKALLWFSAWLLHEWALTFFWTGFPWGESAMPWINWAPHLASLWGAGVAGAALAAGFGYSWEVLRQRSLKRMCWALIFWLFLLLPWPDIVGWKMTKPHQTASVALLQTRIAQDLKFSEQGHVWSVMREWADQTLSSIDAQVVVWPETMIPLWSDDPRVEELYRRSVLRMPAHQAWVVGLPWIERDGVEAAYTGTGSNRAASGGHHLAAGGGANQAASHSASSAPYFNAMQWWFKGQPTMKEAPRYEKVHLVPFGEFIPTGFAWFAKRLDIPLSDFSSGPVTQAPVEWAGLRWASLICYEDLFGVELARRMKAMPKEPMVWLNHSNLAWFGPTIAPYQHLQIARWRAAELGKPMLRATNTGMTASIDAKGRVVDYLLPETRGILAGPVQGHLGETFYVKWVHVKGGWEALLLCCFGFLVVGYLRIRK